MSIEEHKSYVQSAVDSTKKLHELMDEHPDLPIVFYSKHYDGEGIRTPDFPRVGMVLSTIDIPECDELKIYRDFIETDADRMNEYIYRHTRNYILEKVRQRIITVADGDEFERLIHNEVERVKRACEPFWFRAIIVG